MMNPNPIPPGRLEQATVRFAETADADEIATLNGQFNESHVSPRQTADALANCPDHDITVVAEVKGHIVGFACLRICRSWCYPDPWAELAELYVLSQYRRQGLGQAMVAFLEACARDAGATEVLLLTGAYNHEGQAFYRSCGYTEQPKITFSKQLTEEG